MTMHEKVVLIGAGSTVFTRGLVVDMIQHQWAGELALVDTDPVALSVAEGLTRKLLDASGSSMRLSASTNRTHVLTDATVVISTIGVGGRRAWEQDVVIPRKYNIHQPVGDTVMPGGSSRALRMIPAMVDIARDVMDICPDAFFFNYANPMSPVCRAIQKANGAPVVGLCHGVPYTAELLAWFLDVPLAELQYSAVGINHLTWFTQISRHGTDLMPELRAIARSRLGRAFTHDPLPAPGPTTQKHGEDNPFTWQLTELFGAFPAVMDRHIVEFFPHMFGGEGGYFGQTLGTADAFGFEGIIEGGDACFEEMKSVALSPDPLPDDYFQRIGGEQEQAIEMIETLRRDGGKVYSANVPNGGQVPNLPREAVIECPCLFDIRGVHPIHQPPLPAGLAGTLATRFQWVETIVEAALEGSRDKFIQALLLDAACSTLDVAASLADDLLEAHAEYLPQFA
jgi:alpha-galactosidase